MQKAQKVHLLLFGFESAEEMPPCVLQHMIIVHKNPITRYVKQNSFLLNLTGPVKK